MRTSINLLPSPLGRCVNTECVFYFSEMCSLEGSHNHYKRIICWTENSCEIHVLCTLELFGVGWGWGWGTGQKSKACFRSQVLYRGTRILGFVSVGRAAKKQLMLTLELARSEW